MYSSEYEDFAFYLNSYELFDISFKRRPFTWWNGGANKEIIFKILDKMMTNQEFQN